MSLDGRCGLVAVLLGLGDVDVVLLKFSNRFVRNGSLGNELWVPPYYTVLSRTMNEYNTENANANVEI
jgi:hypothetical protein